MILIKDRHSTGSSISGLKEPGKYDTYKGSIQLTYSLRALLAVA